MIQQFTIPGRLPSLNDLIHAMNHNRYTGAGLKRTAEFAVAASAIVAHLKPMTGPVRVYVTWYEGSNRRDRDNITSGVKFILDALQPASRRHPRGIGIIPGDGPKHIPDAVRHTVHVDKHNPRVVVTLEDVS